MYLFPPKYEIVGKWRDDLIWCPSQCYLNIKVNKRHFVVYLRWRHSDPWTANLIEVIPDGSFNDDDSIEWYPLDIHHWKGNNNLDSIKKDVLNSVNEWIKINN